MQSVETDQAPASMPPAMAGLGVDFLKRTLRSTVITIVLVWAAVAVYSNGTNAGYYLFFAAWTTAFFSTTAVLFLGMNDKKKLVAAGLGKVALLVIAGWMVFAMQNVQGEVPVGVKLAMFGGISTPLAVGVLRAFAVLMTFTSAENARRKAVSGQSGGVTEQSPNGNLESHS